MLNVPIKFGFLRPHLSFLPRCLALPAVGNAPWHELGNAQVTVISLHGIETFPAAEAK